MAYPTFTVDESIEPKAAAQALEELRRMAKYGRMADRALKSIREKGFYDGFAPLAGQRGFCPAPPKCSGGHGAWCIPRDRACHKGCNQVPVRPHAKLVA